MRQAPTLALYFGSELGPSTLALYDANMGRMPDAESNKPKSSGPRPRAQSGARPGGATTSAKASAPTKAPAKAPAKAAPAAKPAAPAPAKTPAPASAGDDNPLHKKLRLRPGDAGLVIAPPEDDDNPLLPLPKGFAVLAGLGDLAKRQGQFDYLHVFARDRVELVEAFGLLHKKLRPGGSLWISWLKVSGKHGGGQAIDLNENVIRRLALTHGLVDIKVAALDRDWSALLLVHRKH